MEIARQFIQSNWDSLVLFLTMLIFLFFIWLAVISLKLRRVKEQSAIFFSGKKIPNLEELLADQAKTIKSLDKEIQDLYGISNQINKLAHQGIHKVGMVRFNPFRDVGGDQSFAIALLNGKHNGLTISSLYTREGTRIYAKAISAGESEKHPLTQEEKKAIEQAIQSYGKK